jgi:hypothetical protein
MNDYQAREFVESVARDIWAAKDLEKFDLYYHPELLLTGYQPDGGETVCTMSYGSLRKSL